MDPLIERLKTAGMSTVTAEMVVTCARLGSTVEGLEGQLLHERRERESQTVEEVARVRAAQAAATERQAQEALAREAAEKATPADQTAPEAGA